MKKIITILMILIAIPSVAISTKGETEKKLFTMFKQGKYEEIIEYLEESSQQIKKDSTYHYWLGISHSRLNDFDIAIKHFKNSLKLTTNRKDTYYELGQALYSANYLKRSRKSFYRSYKKNYQPLQSLYYIAYASQILEDYKTAKKTYSKLIARKDIDKNTLQVARFNMAEIALIETNERSTKKQKQEKIENKIVPLYEYALDVDKTSHISNDIKVKLNEIKKKYKIDGYHLKNGRILPRKNLFATATLTITSDDNITNASDLQSTSATKESSIISEPSFALKYRHVAKGRWIFEPKINLTKTTHSEQNIDAVKQNDGYTISTGVKTKLEHTTFKRPSSLAFDLSYKYTGQKHIDPYAEEHFYSRQLKLSLGETANYFCFGDTSLSITYKKISNYSEDMNSSALGFNLMQIIKTKQNHVGVIIVGYENSEVEKLPTYNTTLTSLMGVYIIPKVFTNTNLKFMASIISIETETRGTEYIYSPSIALSTNFFKYFTTEFKYNYESKTSEDDSYKYNKNAFSFMLEISF